MFRKLEFESVPFEPYEPLLDTELVESLRGMTDALKGRRVVHVNSTPAGGGVAEILRSLIPISKGLGLDTDWYVVTPPNEFFDVTKKIHNLMQGADGELTPAEKATYSEYGGLAHNADISPIDADIWILHDPQLLPLMGQIAGSKHPPIVWVCHIDLSAPNRSMLDYVFPNIQLADTMVFSMRQYVPQGLDDAKVRIIPPAIDPLSVKNRPMSLIDAKKTAADMGIDTSRPLATQVSRFDPWKDPWGVVEAFRLAKEATPDVQLAYLGAAHAADDPEGKVIFEELRELTANDADIHLYGDDEIPLEATDLAVSAFQTASDVLMQKSIREGFGLTVTEAMWKGQPVIGGNVGGIRLQIEDGVSGFLVNSPEECGRRIVELLQSPEKRASMGKAARESVRSKFLKPRLLRDYLAAALAAAGDSAGEI